MSKPETTTAEYLGAGLGRLLGTIIGYGVVAALAVAGLALLTPLSFSFKAVVGATILIFATRIALS